jgi:hypothetical protein
MRKNQTFSSFCRGTLALLGCALALAAQALPAGRQTLRGHVPPVTAQLKPVGAMSDTNRLRLALGLALRHPAELAALLRDLYDPSSARFHQYLTPSEFADRFGPTEADYEAVAAFARSHGLSVVHTHANRLLLDVEGTVAHVEKALRVNLNVFQHPTEQRTFYAPEAEPSVEAGLPLRHVSGLDNYQLPKPNLLVCSGSPPFAEGTGSGPGGAFIGHDFRAAYAPGMALDGAGQTVALVEFDTYYTSDITSYENLAGLPPVPVTKVPVDGFSGPPGGGEGEVALDIEMAISMAPGLSQVLVYQAPYGVTSVNNDLLNQIAVDGLANQISCCWFFNIDATTDFIFQEMAAQGQSFFAACGDSGAFYYDPPPLQTDPNITVVGGTTLTTSGPGGAWAAETVWNGFTNSEYFPGAGGSGGVSTTYPIPYWQQTVNMSSNQGSTIWRNVPDVAMIADQILLYHGNGEADLVGGTSCATPLWAGFTAMINQQAAQYGRPPAGFLNPALYGAAQSVFYPSLFHDITTGNNTNSNGATRFFAVPGYDLCTGWGTPAGQALINAFAPPDSLELLPGGGCSFAVTNGVALAGHTQTMILKSTEATTVDWVLGPRPSWLGASVNHGVFSSAQATPVTLSVNGSATNLPPGGYLADLLVSNLTSGVTHLFPVALQVSDPLLLASNSGMAVSGPVGGPFNKTSQVFSLANAAPVPIQWTAQSTSAFASLSPAGGTLAAGAVTNIVATLNPAAGNLLISAQTGNLVFTDLNTTNAQTLPFTLAVGNGGFETGDFSDWTFSGSGGATNFVGSVLELFGDYIHAGEYAAIMGEPGNTASLSQTLPTVPGQLYLLSLFLDNPVGGPTNQFIVKWGGATLFNQLNVAQMFWTNLQFAVFATNSPTTVEFDFRNDADAFGFDDISVTPMSPPSFSSVAVSNSAILFTWSARPGFVYQLQYTTNLAAPLWTNSGAAIIATNSVVTAADAPAADPQRFYRVLLAAP